MPNDRVGTGRKGFDVVLDLLQVSAAQSFGSQLDRRQRVLDFVGNATGDVGPGRLALGRQEFGDVVKRDDKAADTPTVVLRGDADEQGAGAVPANQFYL